MAERDENLQSETAIPQVVDSRECLVAPRQDEIVLNVSDLDTKPLCRICYSGTRKERLIKPCNCKGTIQYVHRHCLERWLEERNLQVCEVCQHEFATERTRKSCLAMLTAPDMQNQRRNFVGDCTCFALLTPLGIATFWLCAEGALYYQNVKSSILETVALATLCVFLVLAYFTWVILCTRYHIIMFSQWRNQNWNVRLVENPSSDETTNSGSDTFINISSDSPEDSTTMTEPLIRYTPGTKGTTDHHVTIIGITPTEMSASQNSSVCNKNKSIA